MNAATLDYIREHAQDDVRQLALRPVPADVDLRAALTQIEGRQLAAHKLPTWAATDGLLYPPRLALEQCSSEATADYKRLVVQEIYSPSPDPSPVREGRPVAFKSNFSPLPNRGGVGGGAVRSSGSVFLDLTGGLGVDFTAIAPLFTHAIYVERQEQLCDLARHNFPLLGLSQAEIRCSTAEEALQSLATPSLVSHFSSFIFMDPARRDAAGRKVARIEDCTPDVCALQEQLRAAAAIILIKLSPMLDLTAALNALRGVTEAHVISVSGECKELLLLMRGCEQKAIENQMVPGEWPSPDGCAIHCVDLPAAGMAAGLSTARRKSDGHDGHEENDGHSGHEESDGHNGHEESRGHEENNGHSSYEEGDGRSCREVSHEAAVPVGFPTGSIGAPPTGFTFTRAEEAAAPLLLAESLSAYLYEPNASILKAGAFKTVCQRFPVRKLAPQAHLYTSQQLIADFPGRIWRIVDHATFSKQDLRRLLTGITAADLTVRGFPTSVATLRRQLHLREGGGTHLIATTLGQQRLLLKVEKTSPPFPRLTPNPSPNGEGNFQGEGNGWARGVDTKSK